MDSPQLKINDMKLKSGKWKKLERETKNFLWFVAFVFASLVIVGNAKAELQDIQAPFFLRCGPTVEVYDFLERDYGEEPSFMAFTDSRSAVVWFLNDTASNFSLVKDDLDGTSCIFWSATCQYGECLQAAAKKSVPKFIQPEISR